MKENYYDILEINKNASKEIIEKSYKTLVKKYHPDLQENNSKINYEEKIKKINEAYEILSNPEKKENYDLNLKNTEITPDDYYNLYNENINLKKELNYLKNNYNQLKNYYSHLENQINNSNNIFKNNNNNQNYYNNEFNNIFKNTNNIYKNYKKNKTNYINKLFKDLIALFLTFLIFFSIFFVLLHIPFTKNIIINFLNETPPIKYFFELFFNF